MSTEMDDSVIPDHDPHRPSLVAPRAESILHELQRDGSVSVEALSARLGVSPSTVRRELVVLERRGLLRRTHGGAISVSPLFYEPFRYDSSFQEQEGRNGEEKRRIGLAAAALVREGDSIGLTAGTTTTQVARSLRHRSGLTIVTNTVNVAMELSNREGLTVLVTGGVLRGGWFSLVGAAAIATVREVFLDRVFIGVNAIHAEHGLTCLHPDEAAINRALVAQARERIVVADHTKLGQVATALIVGVDQANVLITDTGATDEAIAPFLARGIVVRRV